MLIGRLRLRLRRGRASPLNQTVQNGKAKPFRTVLRQSRLYYFAIKKNRPPILRLEGPMAGFWKLVSECYLISSRQPIT